MPDHRSNPNCSETHATFRVVDDKCIPASITRDTGIEPDYECHIGEPLAAERAHLIANSKHLEHFKRRDC